MLKDSTNPFVYKKFFLLFSMQTWCTVIIEILIFFVSWLTSYFDCNSSQQDEKGELSEFVSVQTLTARMGIYAHN